MEKQAVSIGIQSTVALGGVAALSWEVLWQLGASLSLGVSATGTAMTLAVTMAGMTVGSLLMGRALKGRNVEQPLLVYAALEAVIGVSGLLLQPGFDLVERLDSVIFGISPDLAPATHLVSIAMLLGPPTIAMGATVPVFELIGRATGTSVARLYGINTAGAAAGVMLFSFVLIPMLGVAWTCITVAIINFSVTGLTIALNQQSRGEEHQAAATRIVAADSPLPTRAALFVVFATGFVTFGLEVAWFRSLRAAFQSTTESFAIILASVLIPLAIAARLVPKLRARGITPGQALMAAGIAILLATPLIERMDLIIRFYIVSVSASGAAASSTAPALNYTWLMLTWLGTSIVVMGPSILCLGFTLPWYLEEFSEPNAMGRLYGSNTLGAVFGSLVCAWLLLPTMGFAQCAWLLGGVTIVAALVAPGAQRVWPGLFATAIAFTVAFTTTSDLGTSRVQGPSRLREHQVVDYAEGPDSTVAVLQGPVGVRRLLIDGFVATSEDMKNATYMQWMGRLPMMLHPDPQEALVICFGTGQTANAVRREESRHLDVVDVSETVLGMAPHFLSNEGVLEDPSVSPIAMDGRAWLRRTQKKYDVITLEPMPPHFAGVNALYSREFYEIAASRLSDDGVVAQWLPIHLVPPFYASSIVAAFIDVFPDAILWISPADSTGILLGRKGEQTVPLGKEWPGFERDIARPLPASVIAQAAVLDIHGLKTFAAKGSVITDDNQLLAYGLLAADLVGGRFSVMQKQNARRIKAIAQLQPPTFAR